VVLSWHASTYFCILLGYFGDVLQTKMVNNDCHDVDMELKDINALDIHKDVLVFTYLYSSEVHVK
jgi:hypothetical protein